MRQLRGALGALVGASLGVIGLIALSALYQERFTQATISFVIFVEFLVALWGVLMPALGFWMISEGGRLSPVLPISERWQTPDRFPLLGASCTAVGFALGFLHLYLALSFHYVNLAQFQGWQLIGCGVLFAGLVPTVMIAAVNCGGEVLGARDSPRPLHMLVGGTFGLSVLLMLAVMLGISASWLTGRVPTWIGTALVLGWLLLLWGAVHVAWCCVSRTRRAGSEFRATLGAACACGALLAAALHVFLLSWLEYGQPSGLANLVKLAHLPSPFYASALIRVLVFWGVGCFGWFFGTGLAARTSPYQLSGGRYGVVCGMGVGMLVSGLLFGYGIFGQTMFARSKHLWPYAAAAIAVALPALLGLLLGLRRPRVVTAPAESGAPRGGFAIRVTGGLCGALFVGFLLVVAHWIQEQQHAHFEGKTLDGIYAGVALMVLIGYCLGSYVADQLRRLAESWVSVSLPKSAPAGPSQQAGGPPHEPSRAEVVETGVFIRGELPTWLGQTPATAVQVALPPRFARLARLSWILAALAMLDVALLIVVAMLGDPFKPMLWPAIVAELVVMLASILGLVAYCGNPPGVTSDVRTEAKIGVAICILALLFVNLGAFSAVGLMAMRQDGLSSHGAPKSSLRAPR